MLETFLWWLLAAFVFVVVAGVVIYLVARWIFIATAERMAVAVDRRIGAAAAHAFTRWAAYANATGIPLDEANRFFSVHIDRLAKLMDSAIRLPILGPIGLDAIIGLVPVVGDLAGTAFSLTLVARTLRYGPPAALVSKMLSNVLVDLILGSIPLIGFFADVWFKSNDRNAALMRDFLDSRSQI
ncbi:MAG: DUF4112 domain-containing protein [Acidobacteriota bacterium]|nr:DUF4112 domain-containing protein [Acidobacteriota bacterium]